MRVDDEEVYNRVYGAWWLSLGRGPLPSGPLSNTQLPAYFSTIWFAGAA